jgi:hypothetical protein
MPKLSRPAKVVPHWQPFASLGADAHQRPWFGLPALVLSAVPLALLTLVLNVFAAVRDGSPASSLHVVVRKEK